MTSTPGEGKSDLVAIGTANGSVLIYNLKANEVKSCVEKAHDDKVNALVSPLYLFKAVCFTLGKLASLQKKFA